MKWTRAQRETIETRGKNILVSAAAGSGKTTVLIERIKQLVLRDRVDIDRFLITTFTNAAAAEMKEKMERAIRQELDRPDPMDPADRVFLQRQLDLLPQASISTFHTFATGIIRDFFYLTNLQPGFGIGDETRLAIMRREAVDEVFEARFETDGEAFRAFLRKYSGDRSEERLKDQVLSMYQQMRSIPRYMDWAQAAGARMADADPLGALGIDRFILEETAGLLTEAIRWYDAGAGLLDREETGSLYLKARQDAEKLEVLRSQALAVLAERERRAAAAGTGSQVEVEAEVEAGVDAGPQPQAQAGGTFAADFDELQEALTGFKANQMRAAKAEKDAYEQVKDQVTYLRGQGKKCLDLVRESYYSQTPAESARVLQAVASDTAYFTGLIREVEAVYLEKKQGKNLIDFDDCMHYAIQILEDPGAAAEYRARFAYIFIDEYQDSNLLQEEIIGRIARENNLFMVGDVKQSIYRFRLAEPEIFRRRYEAYRSGKEADSIRIDLNSNFRSRRTIRHAVNRIFEKIMAGYDDDAALHGPEEMEGNGKTVEGPDAARTSAWDGDPVQLHILSTAGSGIGDGPEAADPGPDASLDLRPVEAAPQTEYDLIAQIIRRSLGQPLRQPDGTIRPIECGDIAVLSRGGSAVSQIERFLNREGIPAFGETAGGYYETVEIQVFLNLLRVISNPSQDVALISAMHSVVFDFSPRELALIRIECREGSFYDAVRWYEGEGSISQLREKIAGMFGQIRLWKEIARTVPLDELMRRLLYETGYYDYCSGLPVGQQRTSNLRLLLEKAAAYEETSHLGLYGFLSYVEAMRRTRQKVSEASLMGEGRSVVHVMTVHKSKGLEFPVVILAGAGHRISSASEGRAPTMHRDLGIGLAEVNPAQHWSRKTLLQKAIAGKKRREGLEEEIRILYVALTRPIQRLAIVGSVKDLDKLPAFPGYGSFLEMIYPVLSDMAAADPAAAQVYLHDGSGRNKNWAEAGPAGPPLAEAAKGADRPKRQADVADALPLDPDQIHARLSWVYPHREDSHVKTKYAVTELVRRIAGEAEPDGGDSAPVIPALRIPAEAAETAEKLSAAQIGTAMHTVMEHIDFAQALAQGLPYIRERTDRLHADGFLTDAEYDAVRPGNIAAFFEDAVGAQAARAKNLHREQEFLLQEEVDGVPAIVQGIIDCYFEDEQGLVLIDYKNSWVGSDAQEETVVRRYAGQIRLYAKALALALGRPVDAAWLYLFRSRRFVAIPLAQDGGTADA